MNSVSLLGITPKYKMIGAQLLEDIESGRMQPGTQLPTEAELSKRFNVNRLTVRQAVAELQRVGAIEIRRGIGTFVMTPSDLVEIAYSVPMKRQVLDSVIGADQGDQSSTPIIQVEEQYLASGIASGRDGEYAAHEMHCDIGDLAELDTLMVRNHVPWIVNTYWLDKRYDDALDHIRSGKAVVKTLVMDLALELHYSWRAFSAISAGYEESNLLNIPLGTALLVRDGVTSDSSGTPIFYVRRRIRGETAKFVLRYREDRVPEESDDIREETEE